MPRIYKYVSYRRFIDDWVRESRDRTRKDLASLVGCAPSRITQVLNGDGNLGPGMEDRFCEALNLDPEEGDYFRLLVRYEDARTNFDTRYLKKAIFGIRAKHRSLHPTGDQYQLYSAWFLPTLVELTRCAGFDERSEWLASHLLPPVPRGDIERAWVRLKNLDFIRYGRDDKLVPPENVMDNAEPPAEEQDATRRRTLMTRFHRWMLGRAIKILDKIERNHPQALPREERQFHTVTLSAQPEQLDDIAAAINEFMSEIVALGAGNEPPTRVYQLNLQLFPTSLPTEER